MSSINKWIFFALILLSVPLRVLFMTMGDVISNITLCFYLIAFSRNEMNANLNIVIGKQKLILLIIIISICFLTSYNIFWILRNFGNSKDVIYDLVNAGLVPSRISGNMEVIQSMDGTPVALRYLFLSTLPSQAYVAIFFVLHKELADAVIQIKSTIQIVSNIIYVIVVAVIYTSTHVFINSTNIGRGSVFRGLLSLLHDGSVVPLFLMFSVLVGFGSVFSIVCTEYLAVKTLSKRHGKEKADG